VFTGAALPSLKIILIYLKEKNEKIYFVDALLFDEQICINQAVKDYFHSKWEIDGYIGLGANLVVGEMNTSHVLR
jgi:hypothetical protein